MEKSQRSAKETAEYIAEKKAAREQREICIHKEELLEDKDVYYVTPREKAAENVRDAEFVDSFEPDRVDDERFQRQKIQDYSNLESGDRVIINREDVHTITEVTTRQIVTNFGDKFRKSDGVEWGGGEKSITHKLNNKE